MNKINILGNSLSALVASLALGAEKSNQVTLYADGRLPGGHFLGTKIEGHSFDNGMIYVERAKNFAIKPHCKAPYDPYVRYDWMRFGYELDKFLSSNIVLKQVSTPICFINNEYYPDPLISNRLDSIIAFQGTLPNVCNFDATHPRYKNDPKYSKYWENLTYLDAIKHAHGNDFHERFISPFFQKICPQEERENILAKYHRMLWLPLYYPETVHAAFADPTKKFLPEYEFYTTTNNFVGELVTTLLDKVKACPNISLLPEPIKKISVLPEGINISLDTSETTLGLDQSFYSGLSLDRFVSLVGTTFPFEDKLNYTGIKICYLLVKTSSIRRIFSTLNILDLSSAPLRITNADCVSQDAETYSRVTIEYPLDFYAPSGGDVPPDAQIQKDISEHLGIADPLSDVKILKKMVLDKALTLPTKHNLNVYEKMRKYSHDHFPWMFFLGSSSYYGSASMNDQIIQGLSLRKGFYE